MAVNYDKIREALKNQRSGTPVQAGGKVNYDRIRESLKKSRNFSAYKIAPPPPGPKTVDLTVGDAGEVKLMPNDKVPVGYATDTRDVSEETKNLIRQKSPNPADVAQVDHTTSLGLGGTNNPDKNLAGMMKKEAEWKDRVEKEIIDRHQKGEIGQRESIVQLEGWRNYRLKNGKTFDDWKVASDTAKNFFGMIGSGIKGASQIGEEILKSPVGMAKDAWAGIKALGRGAEGMVLGSTELLSNLYEQISRTPDATEKRRLAKEAGYFYGQDGRLHPINTYEGIMESAGQGFVSMVPPMVAGLIGNMVGGPTVGTAASAVVGGVMEDAQAYGQARDMGADMPLASKVGIAAGVINAGLEGAVPAIRSSKIVGKLSGTGMIKESLKKKIISEAILALGEGATEVTQQMVTNQLVKSFVNHKQELAEGLVENGVGGVTASVLMAALEALIPGGQHINVRRVPTGLQDKTEVKERGILPPPPPPSVPEVAAPETPKETPVNPPIIAPKGEEKPIVEVPTAPAVPEPIPVKGLNVNTSEIKTAPELFNRIKAGETFAGTTGPIGENTELVTKTVAKGFDMEKLRQEPIVLGRMDFDDPSKGISKGDVYVISGHSRLAMARLAGETVLPSGAYKAMAFDTLGTAIKESFVQNYTPGISDPNVINALRNDLLTADDVKRMNGAVSKLKEMELVSRLTKEIFSDDEWSHVLANISRLSAGKSEQERTRHISEVMGSYAIIQSFREKYAKELAANKNISDVIKTLAAKLSLSPEVGGEANNVGKAFQYALEAPNLALAAWKASIGPKPASATPTESPKKQSHDEKRKEDFIKAVKKLSTETANPEQVAVVVAILGNMDPSIFRQVPLKVRESAKMVSRLGHFKWSGWSGPVEFAFKRGLSEQFKKSDPLKFATTFFHEFGHFSDRYILTEDENRIVENVYNSKSKKEWQKFFADTALGQTKNEKYYAKDRKEFFAQAFSYYSLTRDSVDPKLTPIFDKLLKTVRLAFDKVKQILSGTSSPIKEMYPIFDRILEGKGLEGQMKKAPVTKTREGISKESDISDVTIAAKEPTPPIKDPIKDSIDEINSFWENFIPKDAAEKIRTQLKIYNPEKIEDFTYRVRNLFNILRANEVKARLGRPGKNVLGYFDPRVKPNGLVVADDELTPGPLAPVLGHETGHAIDFNLPKQMGFKMIKTPDMVGKGRGMGIQAFFGTTDDIRGELEKVTANLIGVRTIRPNSKNDLNMIEAGKLLTPKGAWKQANGVSILEYFQRDTELIARFLEAVMSKDPSSLAAAPKTVAAFEKQMDKYPFIRDYMDVASRMILEADKNFIKDNLTGDFLRTTGKILLPKSGQLKQAYGDYVGNKIFSAFIKQRFMRLAKAMEMQKIWDRHFAPLQGKFISKFKTAFTGKYVTGDKVTDVMDAAEAIKSNVDGNKVFGTKDYKKVLFVEQDDPSLKALAKFLESVEELKDAGYQEAGTVMENGKLFQMFSKDRFTKEEGEALWNNLSPEAKKVVDDYTKAASEAKDEFNRNLLAEKHKIKQSIEGYVHHTFRINKPQGWVAKKLKTKVASSMKRRKGAEGYLKNLREASQKQATELELVKLYNEHVEYLVELGAKVIDKNEDVPKGWTAIYGSTKTGFGPNKKELLIKEDGKTKLLMVGKKRIIPDALYEQLQMDDVKFREQAELAKYLRLGETLMAANLLAAPSTVSTNFIGGFGLYVHKMIVDIVLDSYYLMDGRVPKRFASDLLSLAMTPFQWNKLDSSVYGGRKSSIMENNYGGFTSDSEMSSRVVNAVSQTMMATFGMVEDYFKKAIMNSERMALGLKTKDISHSQFVEMVNKVINEYAFDYFDVPTWMEKSMRYPGAKLIKPFVKYPYKYAELMLRTVHQATIKPIMNKQLPAPDKAAKLLSLMFIHYVIMAFMRQKDEEDKSNKDDLIRLLEKREGEVVAPTPLNIKGRVPIGTDDNGNTMYLRPGKYPFLSTATMMHSMLKGDYNEFISVAGDLVGSGGLGYTGLLDLLGYTNSFSKFKDLPTRLASDAAAPLLPLYRTISELNFALDEFYREKNSPSQIFNQGIPMFTPEDRDKYLGKPRVFKVPLPSGESRKEWVQDKNGKWSNRKKKMEEIMFRKNLNYEMLKFLSGINIKTIEPDKLKAVYDRAIDIAIEKAGVKTREELQDILEEGKIPKQE
jgi:hypothetical protein